MYHTQEHRSQQMTQPGYCDRDDAWLGAGYYFWYHEHDAYMWGQSSKCRKRYFEVYQANIDCENVVDTVFNEEQYLFWKSQIEKAARVIVKKTHSKPTLKELNDYFKERGHWDEVDGIMFQDMLNNHDILQVKPIIHNNRKRVNFAYLKRIQLVAFNLDIVLSFDLKETMPCNH